MKAILITLGTVAALGLVLVAFLVIRVSGTIRKAHGQALYSSVGAWTRIREFAQAQGKSNYIAEADSKLAFLEDQLKTWRKGSSPGLASADFEKMRTTAYETTDRNIKNGQNPLAYLDTSYRGSEAGNFPQSGSEKVPGMSDFEYLACDGGPHLVLPKEFSKQWKGAGSILGVLNSSSDYGKACAVTNEHMGLISVGSGQAMVLADPPLSAWGRSPEGWVDIYYLDAWPDRDTDATVKRAVSTTPTSAMKDIGKTMTLKEPGMILLFAGDKPGSSAYGESEIPIDAGSYQILEGHYKAGTVEEIHIYRLKPKKP